MGNLTAYTVGYTEGYERYLSTDPHPGKGVGGIAFRTREEAEAALEDGCLPIAWGYGPGRKASVYGLILTKPFEQQTSRDADLVAARFHDWHDDAGSEAIIDCPICSQRRWRVGPDGQLDYDALIEPTDIFKLDP